MLKNIFRYLKMLEKCIFKYLCKQEYVKILSIWQQIRSVAIQKYQQKPIYDMQQKDCFKILLSVKFLFPNGFSYLNINISEFIKMPLQII